VTSAAAVEVSASETSRISRAWSWVRLSFAMQRWELLFVLGGVALLAAAMLWIAWQARLFAAANLSCLDFSTYQPGCDVTREHFRQLTDLGAKLLYFSYAAPYGMGLILGVPLVAREVDHGTASVAWTLSRSRVRWWLSRIVFAALVVIGLLTVVAIVSDVVAQAIQPSANLAADFTWHGRRGGLLVMRGLLALGMGVGIGAILGRQLPALLVAIFAAVGIFTGVSLGMDRWLQADAVPTPYGVEIGGDLRVGDRVELPDGRLVSFADLDSDEGYNIAIGPDGTVYTSFDQNGVGSDPIGRAVSLIVPGKLYPTFVLRESAVLGGLALLVSALALVVVQRRRPY
jgi:ABC-type transport system involved in multi-copper enzyme maturation permease subunit